MRIISNFNDYYDYALSFGVDTTEVFDRKQDDFSFSLPDNHYSALEELLREIKWSNARLYYNVRKNQNGNKFISVIPLFFCGEIYIFFKNEITNEIFTDKKEFIESLQKNYDYKYRLNIDESLLKSALVNLNHISQINNIAYFTFRKVNVMQEYGYKKIDNKFVIKIEQYPILKNLGFQFLKEGHLTFQQIENYLFSTLKMSENETIDISDKDKAIAKGHGGKYSFRTRPK